MGEAGEFVFDQLPSKIRTNYAHLTKELANRFRVVETPRYSAARFSNRSQYPGESVNDYAAELKRLYDKGHPH